MSKENENGVWRTIRGRRIFIADGQSLGEAMTKSGKFNRSDIRETKQQASFDDTADKVLKAKPFSRKQVKAQQKYTGKYGARTINSYNQAPQNRINESSKRWTGGKTRVEQNYDRYSQEDRRELKHENLQKKLVDYRNNTMSKNIGGWTIQQEDNMHKEGRQARESIYQQEQKEKSQKAIADFKAKKQSNNKIDNEKEVREALKSSYIYKDEKSTEPYLEQYKEKYGKEAVDKAFKYYDDNFVVAKGTTMDSEGLTYNSLIDKNEYSKEAIDKYVKGIDKLRNEMQYSYDSKEYNSKADELLKELKDSKNQDLKITDNNFKNNWQDEIKTKEQLLAKEKEVKQQYEDYKKLAEQNKDKWGQTQIQKNKESYEKTLQNIEDWKKEFDNNETFIQNTNMYGGTREYNKEQLDKMAEQGIRPMKNSYTGGGWEGVNSRQNLSTSEQAKAITSEMKKQFPDVKIARSSQNYSGGSSIDFNIMSSDTDLYITDKDIDNLGNEQLFNTDITRGWGFERWAKENVPSYKEQHQYSADDVKRYAKEQLKNMKAHENQNVDGNEWYLSDYGKKVVSALNKEANSYTFDDSDGSIDYFHHCKYMDISIGKWDKPYQVNESKKIKDYVSKKKSNHK